MNRYGNLSTPFGALVVALSPACGTIEVPFMPSSGGAGGSTAEGSDSGGNGETGGARAGGEGGGPPGGSGPFTGGGPASDGGVWGGGAAGGAESRAGEDPRPVLPDPTYFQVVADETHLYFYDDNKLWEYSLDGTQHQVQLSDRDYSALETDGDRLLTVRGSSPGYIAAFPKSGGTWKNILNIGERDCDSVLLRATRFAARCDSNTSPHVLTGVLDDSASLKVLPLSDANQQWALARNALFIADGRELLRASLD